MPAPPPMREQPAPTRLRRVSPVGQSRVARGEGMVWLCGGALVLCLTMIVGLLLLVVRQGAFNFWPAPLYEVQLREGRPGHYPAALLGEPSRHETFRPAADDVAALPEPARSAATAQLRQRGGESQRELLRAGNFELTNEHYYWVPDFLVAQRTRPDWAMLLEREQNGRFHGIPQAYVLGGETVASDPAAVVAELRRHHGEVRARFHAIEDLRKHEVGAIAERVEAARLAARRTALERGEDSPEHRAALAEHERVQSEAARAADAVADRIRALQQQNDAHRLVLRTADGVEKQIAVEEIVRALTPNRLGFFEKVSVYLSRWWEFLTSDPRAANSEGGVYPAIFGTVLMTLLMSLCVVPFGVLAALYLREYAKAGLLISAVRIAVNNLAGVPSIVFGVFGLGFFCYLIGGTIDSVFYPERLPSPTFGKGALIWASLTLALLTLPVVIVATEEALAAVPSSMREGSYACGASKWQTIRRIVLPRAMPGIMTGTILAMARGAGEVAPLMLVGAVKSANELPLDATAPFVHPSRSFMHLGFHIYDLGFQSQNSEAAKPTVYTTTLLLIAIIFLLNITAVWLRNRLRARFVGAQF